MGLRITPQQERELIDMGAVITPANHAAYAPKDEAVAKKKKTPVKLVEPWICGYPSGHVELHVPIETINETNSRAAWQAKNRRAGAAWVAVRKAIGVHLSLLEPFAKEYASNGALRVRFTRLGGRKLDRSNLSPACKGVEDAIAYCLGANDGDPRWHPDWDQDTSWDGVGVRVEISVENKK